MVWLTGAPTHPCLSHETTKKLGIWLPHPPLSQLSQPILTSQSEYLRPPTPLMLSFQFPSKRFCLAFPRNFTSQTLPKGQIGCLVGCKIQLQTMYWIRCWSGCQIGFDIYRMSHWMSDWIYNRSDVMSNVRTDVIGMTETIGWLVDLLKMQAL